MDLLTYNTRVVLIGVSLLGACSGLVGSYAVLRRRALTGDALAHAALPGVCLAFMLFGQKSLPVLLAGALVTGILGILIVTGLRTATRIKEDAAIGIVLSVFFGVGVVLSSVIQRRYQNTAGLDSFVLGSTDEMLRQDVLLIGGVSLGCLLLILALYKEFKLIVFDPGFARVQGWPAGLLDFLLMSMIAVAVVIGLPAVGVVMMAAMLIIPPAAARFWTERFSVLLLVAGAMGAVIGAIGTLASASFDQLPAGPVIVLVGSGFFAISILFGPHRGLIARTLRELESRRRVTEQKLLRMLDHAASDADHAIPLAELSSSSWSDGWIVRSALKQLRNSGLVESAGTNRVHLTAAGRSRAAELHRAAQTWDRFLDEHPDTAANYADLDLETLSDRLPSEPLTTDH